MFNGMKSTITKGFTKKHLTIRLISWGEQYGLERNWIHERDKFPHYDLFGNIQLKILKKEQKWDHIERFQLINGMKMKKLDRKSTRLNSSHVAISYTDFYLKKKKRSLV